MNSKSGCIVITGSSKGIGLGLAQAFLEQQQAVVISGRNSTDLHSAPCNSYGIAFPLR
jgi:short-subunit dehydrogenase involved in D-alanine esterification of teichoic acids